MLRILLERMVALPTSSHVGTRCVIEYKLDIHFWITCHLLNTSSRVDECSIKHKSELLIWA